MIYSKGNGFDEEIVTFEANGNIKVGTPVMVTSNGTVSTALGIFCGICKCIRNGYAAVQLKGYVVVPYIIAPRIGYSRLSAVDGKVTGDNVTGREYLVIDIDTETKTVGFML